MGITIGNPIIITSGTYGTLIEGNHKINRVYWEQPELTTSGLIIRKNSSGGPTLLTMKVEVSGQSQTMDFRTKWWNDPFVVQMTTGTFYIYTE